MTRKEYSELVIAENQRYRDALDKLKTQFALSNNPVKVGDVLEDHYHMIKVEKIIPYGEYCLYSGVELKKDGTPKVRQIETSMHQTNVRAINGDQYTYSKDNS